MVSDTVKRDKPARNFHKNEDVLSERFYGKLMYIVHLQYIPDAQQPAGTY